MFKGAINEIRANVPEQFKPKAADADRFSKAFVSAINGVGDDQAALEQEAAKQREATLNHQLLSMAAAQRGENSAAGRALTGSAAAVANTTRQQIEQKKKEDEATDRAIKTALEAMKQRFDEIAEYWGKIADEYEEKLGGLDGVAQKLGVERPKNMPEEEERRWYNDLILMRIANGEIDPNSDLAKMAQARGSQYEAQSAGQEADALIREGKVEEAERLVEGLEGKVLKDRTANELNSSQVSEIIDVETVRRDDIGVAEGRSFNGMEKRDEASVDFWATGNDDFAASAQSLAMTESFNTAAAGMVSAPAQEIELNQQAQFAALKPTGMMGG